MLEICCVFSTFGLIKHISPITLGRASKDCHLNKVSRLPLENFHPPHRYFQNFVGFPHNRYFWKILCRFAASQYFFENNFTNVLKLLWFHFGPFRLQTEQCHVVFLKKITVIWSQHTKKRNIRLLRFCA